MAGGLLKFLSTRRSRKSKAHFGLECIALIAGLRTSFDDPRQQIVHELATTVATPRTFPVGIFERAKELLGDKSVVEVTVLMDWFTMVSVTLMAYDVPQRCRSEAVRSSSYA